MAFDKAFKAIAAKLEKDMLMNFIWKDDEITQVISKKEAKEIFGDAILWPNDDITKCQHKWVKYTGLHEVDTFCEKCKEKK